jgi:DNA-binding transcriptional ArsR family regulator
MLLGLGASGTPLPHGELLLARAAAAPPPLPARDVRHASPLDAAASPGDAGPSSGDSPSGTGAWGDGGSFGGSAHASGAAVAAPPGPGAAQAAAVALAGSAALGLLGLAGVALYHRIRPTTTLENDTRKAIFDAVSQTPGLGVHAIAASAGVSYSTATYHLERLVSAGMLVMTPDGNRLCYYQNGGAFTESERRILPLLKNDEAARLFETILLNPGTYRAALAERLGVTATTINWHLRRLREADLVRESRQGRSAYLYANALAIEQALPALAQKLTASDLDVAERIRRYTGAPPASASS